MVSAPLRINLDPWDHRNGPSVDQDLNPVIVGIGVSNLIINQRHPPYILKTLKSFKVYCSSFRCRTRTEEKSREEVSLDDRAYPMMLGRG